MPLAHRSAALLLSLALGVTGPVLVPGGDAQAATATCDGRPATIEGNHTQRTLTGTSGDDVIVSRGARVVDAGAGDDTICLTGLLGSSRNVVVDAGEGDDLVRDDVTDVPRSATEQSQVTIRLGAGDDVLMGGRAAELVSADGDDVVLAAGGDDVVLVGGSDDAAPFTGEVHLGEGGGDLYVGPRTTPGAVLDGGTGPSFLRLRTAFLDEPGWDPTLNWSIDVPAGTAAADGAVVLTFEDVHGFFWGEAEIETFVGSDADDTVGASAIGTANLGDGSDQLYAADVDRADLGGGDDRITLDTAYVATPEAGGGTVDAGPGDDQLVVLGDAVHADLEDGLVSTATGRSDTALSGLETFRLEAPTVQLEGSDDADEVVTIGCTSTLEGRGGDDVLTAYTVDPEEYGCGRRDRATLRGGPGADVLLGATRTNLVLGGPGDDRLSGLHVAGYLLNSDDRLTGGGGDDTLDGYGGDDVLVGGAGRDTALGGTGRDRCSGETERSCER